MDEIKEYEVTSGQKFLVENMSFADYVKSQWENHKAQKEAEKLKRVCLLVTHIWDIGSGCASMKWLGILLVNHMIVFCINFFDIYI